MGKTYLHVSYITSKGDGGITYGDMLIQTTKNASMKGLREYILEEIKKDNPEYAEKYQLPAILSVTPIKKKLYMQLIGE